MLSLALTLGLLQGHCYKINTTKKPGIPIVVKVLYLSEESLTIALMPDGYPYETVTIKYFEELLTVIKEVPCV